MKYGKEISLIVAGSLVGFVLGGISVINAELKCKAIRTAFVKVIAYKITDVMVGPRKREPCNTKVSYRNYYDHYKSINVDDIVFDTRRDAETILDAMANIKNAYDVVTVADLYELSGLSSNYNDNRYGWTDISGVTVFRVRDGYMLKLPKARFLN